MTNTEVVRAPPLGTANREARADLGGEMPATALRVALCVPELAWTSGFPRGAGLSAALTGPPPYRLLDQWSENTGVSVICRPYAPDEKLEVFAVAAQDGLPAQHVVALRQAGLIER